MLASSSQREAVEALRRRILGWESSSGEDAPSFSSGCPALDRLLPGRGFPRGALIEFLADRGSGAVALSLVAAREACREGGALVVIDRERQFYPPAAANLGIDLANALFVRPRHPKRAALGLEPSAELAGHRGGVVVAGETGRSRVSRIAARRGNWRSSGLLHSPDRRAGPSHVVGSPTVGGGFARRQSCAPAARRSSAMPARSGRGVSRSGAR